jgi:hypothetical protein
MSNEVTIYFVPVKVYGSVLCFDTGKVSVNWFLNRDDAVQEQLTEPDHTNYAKIIEVDTYVGTPVWLDASENSAKGLG